jgi:hypothetical protein
MDPGLGTDGRHDSAKRKPTRIFQKKIIPKKNLVRLAKILGRITAKKGLFKKKQKLS